MSSFFDLDGDGRVLDDVFGAGAAATMGAAGLIPGLGPVAAAAAPFAYKGANMWGDHVSNDIKKGGSAAEIGAWIGGVGMGALTGPLGGMVGASWGSRLGPMLANNRPTPGGPAPVPGASPASPEAPQSAIMRVFGGMY